jgi:hypothetical protein
MEKDLLILYFHLRMMDKKIAGHGAYVETITTWRATFKHQLNLSRYRSMESVCPTSYLPRKFTGFKSGGVGGHSANINADLCSCNTVF